MMKKIKILVFLGILLGLISIVLLQFSSFYIIDAKATPESNNVVIEYSGTSLPTDLEEALNKELKTYHIDYKGKKYLFKNYLVYDYRYYQNWVMANVVIKDHPTLASVTILDEGSEESRLSLIAKKDHDTWEIVLSDNTKDFINYIDQLPDGFVDKISKNRFKKYYAKNAKSQSQIQTASFHPASVNPQTVDYKYPWHKSQQWKITNQDTNGWHGGTCNGKCARDFTTPNNLGTWEVLAAADGTVSGFCSFIQNTQNVYIIDDDGNQVGYVHLARPSVTVTVGQRVSQGTPLGNAYEYSGSEMYIDSCGRLTGTHLHMILPYQNNPEMTPNMIIDGWQYTYPNCPSLNGVAKCSGPVSSTNSSIEECIVPLSGIWHITKSCIINGNPAVASGIVIENGVTLVINPDSSLGYDLYASLIIKNGGKLLIKSGGHLSSYSN